MKQKQTHRHREQTDICQRGGDSGLGEIGEEIKQKKETLKDMGNSMVITREKGGGKWKRVNGGK